MSCAYTPSPQALGDGTTQPLHPVATVQDRIKQLEDLVVDLMQKTSASNAPPLASSNPSPGANTPLALNHASPRVSPSATPVADGAHRANSPDSDHGSLRLTKSGASYVHGTHWAAVLDGIAELKDHFDRDDESRSYPLGTAQPPQVNLSGPQLIHGFTKVATRDEILAAVPPRHIVDRLVSRYFNSFEMSPGKQK